MKNKGFTLVEVLAVITVIAILAMVIIPTMSGILDKGKQAAYENQLQNIETAAKFYVKDNIDSLLQLKTIGGVAYVTLDQLINSGYIEDDVVNPLTGENFDNDLIYVMARKSANKNVEYFAIDPNNTESFSKSYGGSDNDSIASGEGSGCAIMTKDGGSIIVGTTLSNNNDITDGNNGGYDIVLIKLDDTGQKEWDKTYGSTGNDYGISIVETSDGGYAVLGKTSLADGDVSDGNNGLADFWLIKVNANGNKQWDKTYGGSGEDTPRKLLLNQDGTYILIGSSTSPISGDISGPLNTANNGLVFKIGLSGNKIWDKCFGSSAGDYFRSGIITYNGDIILVGSTYGTNGDITDGNNGLEDLWILKISSTGNKVFSKTYGGTDYENAYNITIDDDGNYVIVGRTMSSIGGDLSDGTNGSYDILIIKIDSTGSKIWDRTYGGTSAESGHDIIQNYDDDYVVIGITSSTNGDVTSTNHGGVDTWLIEITKNGNLVENKTYGSTMNEYSSGIYKDKDGGYYISGNSNGSNGDILDGNHGSDDLWFLKLKDNFIY